MQKQMNVDNNSIKKQPVVIDQKSVQKTVTTPGEDQICGDAKNQIDEFVNYISTERVVDP